MLYELLTTSAKKYAARPFPFIYAALMRLFSVTITAFFALAIILLLILTLTTFDLMTSYGLLATVIITIAAALFFTYFWAAYKGAMIKTLMNAEISAVHLHDYLRYALQNASRYSSIFMVKHAVLLLFNIPIILAMFFLKLDYSSVAGIGLILLGLLLSFTCKFVFSFAYIAAAVRELPAIPAIRSAVGFVLKNVVRAFAIYVLYAIVWAMLLVPLLNIAVFVSLYPMMYLVMINFYRSESYKAAPFQPAAPPTPAAPQPAQKYSPRKSRKPPASPSSSLEPLLP